MKCNKCGGKPIKTFYAVNKFGSKHLIIKCEKCGYRHMPYIKDLPIPVRKTGDWL